MPKKEEFVLKDSDPEFIKAAGVQPRGREYDAACAKKPGAIRIDDVLLGTKLACIAITDDDEETLAKVGKMNPWHIEALKMITGSEEEAHKPLTHILDKHFNLKCDKILDLTGWSGGRPIDTQGYIAHNDEMIVVSFRCTTSALDWMTNLATTSSEWELDEDVAQGHSGVLSCFEGRCFVKGPKKPRVHTGMYMYVFFAQQTHAFDEEKVSPPHLYFVLKFRCSAFDDNYNLKRILQQHPEDDPVSSRICRSTLGAGSAPPKAVRSWTLPRGWYLNHGYVLLPSASRLGEAAS